MNEEVACYAEAPHHPLFFLLHVASCVVIVVVCSSRSSSGCRASFFFFCDLSGSGSGSCFCRGCSGLRRPPTPTGCGDDANKTLAQPGVPRQGLRCGVGARQLAEEGGAFCLVLVVVVVATPPPLLRRERHCCRIITAWWRGL